MSAFRNARIVLADRVIQGSISIEDGLIAAIDSGVTRSGEDLDGDYLIPGMQLRPELGDPGASGFALHTKGTVAAD